MSHTVFTYHIVFGTYLRKRVIDINHERELYKYIYDFSTSKGIKIRRIGGMPDHIHILCDIPPKIAVADFIKILKSETSKFMRMNSHFPFWEGWAEGYGGFTVDASLRSERVAYIMNQKQHHSRFNFEDEYRQIMTEAGYTMPEDTSVNHPDP